MWLICILFVLVKGDIASRGVLGFLDVDLVAIIIAYLFLYCGATIAGVFAFTQGLLMDTYSAGLFGLFSLLYFLVFWGVAAGSRFFDFNTARGLFLLVLVVTLAKSFLFVVVLGTFQLGSDLSSYSLFKMATSAVVSALVAPLIFRFLGPFRHLFIKGETNDVLVKGGPS